MMSWTYKRLPVDSAALKRFVRRGLKAYKKNNFKWGFYLPLFKDIFMYIYHIHHFPSKKGNYMVHTHMKHIYIYVHAAYLYLNIYIYILFLSYYPTLWFFVTEDVYPFRWHAWTRPSHHSRLNFGPELSGDAFKGYGWSTCTPPTNPPRNKALLRALKTIGFP